MFNGCMFFPCRLMVKLQTEFGSSAGHHKFSLFQSCDKFIELWTHLSMNWSKIVYVEFNAIWFLHSSFNDLSREIKFENSYQKYAFLIGKWQRTIIGNCEWTVKTLFMHKFKVRGYIFVSFKIAGARRKYVDI